MGDEKEKGGAREEEGIEKAREDSNTQKGLRSGDEVNRRKGQRH